MPSQYRCFCVVCLLAILLTALPAWAAPERGVAVGRADGSQRRVALVIGNGAYQEGRLRNPVNDARVMAQELGALGFKVIRGEDLDYRGMRHKIIQFGDEINRGGVGLFYFAGHGIQARGQNYLIPIGARIQREAEVMAEGISLESVLRRMEGARNGLNIVILDACRNNPYARGFRSGGSAGLATVQAPQGTFIAYATAPGQVASDGSGDHGLYTEALIRRMRQPGLSIEKTFKLVRVDVAQRSKGKQVPWDESSLMGDFYFQPGASQAPVRLAGGPGPAVDQRQQNVARLLQQAEADLAAGRLTTPPGNNAYERYQKVLSLEPYNATANQGLKRIVGQYVDLARGRIRAGDLTRAEAYLARAEKISEADARVLAARDELHRAWSSAERAEAARRRRAEEQARAQAARRELERLEAERRRQEASSRVDNARPSYQASPGAPIQLTKSGKVASVFKIKDPLFRKYKKAPVTFTHQKHSENYRLACTECHHVYKDGRNVFRAGDKVEPCAKCHTNPKKSQGGMLSLYSAYHNNCRDCHKQAKRGPLKCNDCHPKN